MKVKTITYRESVALVVNYNKYSVDLEATADIGPNEKEEKATEELKSFVSNQLEEAIGRANKALLDLKG